MRSPGNHSDSSTPSICRPPDPAPRAARFVPPPLACDCHAHIIGAPSEYPMVMPRSYTPPPASLAAYRTMLKTIGVQRAVIVQPSFYGTDNRCTRDAVRSSGGAFRGVAVVDPNTHPDLLADMNAEGFRGARINLLFRGGLPLDAMEVLATEINRFGWHLQLLIDIATLPALEKRLARLPCAIVFDHLGHFTLGSEASEAGFQAMERLLDNGRTWVKLSGGYRLSSLPAPYVDLRSFARRLCSRRPDRLVWGSDWPHTSFEGEMPNDGALLDMLADWVPDVETRNRILVNNAAELYGF